MVLNTCGESGSSAFSVGGRRTSSCKTTSVRTTSRLGRIESFSENGFSRTASLKQPSLENNFSENNFSENSFSENNFLQTARTNCEDEPRISSLRIHLCVLARAHRRKGSLPRLCGERVLLRIIDTLLLIGFGLPSTNQAQGEYTRSITEHTSQRV